MGDNDMERSGFADTKLNRRRFLQAMFALSVAGLGLLTSPERMRKSTYKEEEIDSKKMGKEYAWTVSPGGLLLSEHQKHVKEILEANNERKISYQHRIENYTLKLYLPDNYGDSDNREFSGLLKFMKEERPDLWSPISNMTIFAGDFGAQVLTRTMVTASANKAIGYVNSGEYAHFGRPGPGLYIEICQSLMINRDVWSSQMTLNDREVWANTVGQAVWSAKNNETYEQYVDELDLEKPAFGMGGQVIMKPVSEEQYEKIRGFVKNVNKTEF